MRSESKQQFETRANAIKLFGFLGGNINADPILQGYDATTKNLLKSELTSALQIEKEKVVKSCYAFKR